MYQMQVPNTWAFNAAGSRQRTCLISRWEQRKIISLYLFINERREEPWRHNWRIPTPSQRPREPPRSVRNFVKENSSKNSSVIDTVWSRPNSIHVKFLSHLYSFTAPEIYKICVVCFFIPCFEENQHRDHTGLGWVAKPEKMGKKLN